MQSPLIHGQRVAADLLDTPRDALAVLGSPYVEGLEDHQRQRALQDARFLFHSTAMLVANRKGGILPFGKQQVSRRACRCVRRSGRLMKVLSPGNREARP